MSVITEQLIRIGMTEFEAVAVIKLLLSTLCGGLVGLERELKGRPAGLKTFSLVCVGSTLAMITILGRHRGEHSGVTSSLGTPPSNRGCPAFLHQFLLLPGAQKDEFCTKK